MATEISASNRIELSQVLRRPAGIPRKQKLTVSATPGRIIKRGQLKIWTGAVPATPIEEAVEQSRRLFPNIDRE